MSDRIQVTCQHCNHVIKAPRKAAGRRGKCPHCHNSVYVPTPSDELEEIPFASSDDEALAKADRLEKEALEVAAAIRREKDDTPQKARPTPDPPTTAKPNPPVTDITRAICRYLQAMQVSELERAEGIAEELKGSARQAKSKIQQMMVDAMRPDEVRGIPDGLYQGFLRKLLEQL